MSRAAFVMIRCVLGLVLVLLFVLVFVRLLVTLPARGVALDRAVTLPYSAPL